MSQIKGTLSLLKRADGSGEFSNGQTIVWCGINGPGDIQSSKRIYDRANLLCSFNKLVEKDKIGLFLRSYISIADLQKF